MQNFANRRVSSRKNGDKRLAMRRKLRLDAWVFWHFNCIFIQSMAPEPDVAVLASDRMNLPLPRRMFRRCADFCLRQPETLVWSALITGTLLLLYFPVLVRLVGQWREHESYAYGFLVPVFSAWLVWRRRHRLLALPLQPANIGLAWMLGAVALLLLGSLGAELLMTRWSLVAMLAGLILFLFGRAWERQLRFPLLFLLFMFPLPAVIYYQITFPLQVFASRFGVWLLDWTSLPVLRQGNLISLPHFTLDVVAACSGLRSLLSLFALAAAYGYLAETRLWRRLALLAATPPLAIAANGARIALTAALAFQLGPAVEHGVWHMLTGLFVFLLTIFGLLALHFCLRLMSFNRRRYA